MIVHSHKHIPISSSHDVGFICRFVCICILHVFSAESHSVFEFFFVFYSCFSISEQLSAGKDLSLE